MAVHQLVVGTHGSSIHLVEFDPSSSSLVVRHSLRLREQPSWITPSPTVPGLLYVNAWVDDRIYAVQLSEAKGFEVRSETAAGGGGPTHFVVDGNALLAVNVHLSHLFPSAAPLTGRCCSTAADPSSAIPSPPTASSPVLPRLRATSSPSTTATRRPRTRARKEERNAP